jgi:hypothetical protein
VIYWLQVFASPFLFSGIVAFIIYSSNEKHKIIAIAVLCTGIIAGILLAEYIRRKYGLSTFFGNLYGSGDLNKEESK